MKARPIVAVAVAAAALFHLAAVLWVGRIRARQDLAAAQLASRLRQFDETTHRLADARQQLQSSSPPSASAPRRSVSKDGSQPANPGAAQRRSKALALAKDPELRRMSVQSYVDQRRLAFAGLLKKLGFNPDQLREFDQIQAEYEQGLLDAAATAAEQGLDPNDSGPSALRLQLVQTQTVRYRGLFGSSFDQWTEANRTLGARQVVNQIMQENLQGPGAFSGSLADQLTQILANNRTAHQSDAPAADPTGYDWSAVLSQARAVLTPQQMDSVGTGLEFYRTEAQMVAMRTRGNGH